MRTSAFISLALAWVLLGGLNGCLTSVQQQDATPRTIMLILDGLATGAMERIPLPHLQALQETGTYYAAVHLPLPAHPKKSAAYPWSCSLPNPVLMSGTVFIGQPEIRQHLLQHSFAGQPTAFIVNDGAYRDVAGGFDQYFNLREEFADLFRDEKVMQKAKEVIRTEDPQFLRIHLQGPGSAGHMSHALENQEQPWYHDIWHPQSPYVQQMKQADQLVAAFISWLKEEGHWESTTLLILGDHGQAAIGGHPPYRPASSQTELLMVGARIKKNTRFSYAEITDIAPTIAHLHRMSPPRYAIGRVLTEALLTGPDTLPPDRNMQALNNMLQAAHQRKQSGQPLPAEWQGISDISNWHLGLSPPTLAAFIQRQKAQLN